MYISFRRTEVYNRSVISFKHFTFLNCEEREIGICCIYTSIGV